MLPRSTSRWILALWLTASGCASDTGRRGEAGPVALTVAERERATTLFQTHCALCHGELGDGHGVRRAGFQRPPRDFTNPVWARSTSAATVRDLIRNGKPGTPMPGSPSLELAEVEILTAYVLSLGGSG